MEITGLKAGVIGMGATGTMIAAGLQYFGADVRYFSRTRKPPSRRRTATAGWSFRSSSQTATQFSPA